jgi:hypothetical protein
MVSILAAISFFKIINFFIVIFHEVKVIFTFFLKISIWFLISFLIETKSTSLSYQDLHDIKLLMVNMKTEFNPFQNFLFCDCMACFEQMTLIIWHKLFYFFSGILPNSKAKVTRPVANALWCIFMVYKIYCKWPMEELIKILIN